MGISYVIVTKNRPEQLDLTLETLKSQDEFPEEVIIVDDSDTEINQPKINDLREALSNNSLVEHIHRPDGNGMADARNCAIKSASEHIVAFTDDDVALPPEYFKILRKTWQSHPDAGAIGGPAIVVDKEGTPTVEILRDEKNHNYINRFGEQESKAHRWIPPRPVHVDQLVGANMSFRRQHLIDIGLFNTTYPGPEIYEDTDVMARLWRRGEEILYHPQLAIDHYAMREGSEYRYWLARNSIHFRHNQFPENFRKSIFRLFYSSTGVQGAVWKQAGGLVLRQSNPVPIWRGWLDGLRDVM